jgi:hypothetical protein
VLANVKELTMDTVHDLPRSDDARGSTAPAGDAPRRAAYDAPGSTAPAGAAPRRAAYAVLAAALFGAALFELLRHDTGWWQFLAFGAMPDIALFLGIAPGLEKGRLHPRAVPLYNALHRFAGPVAFAAVVVVASLPTGYFVGAVAWGLHIAVDRVAGYGLRTPDGFQRS